MNVPTYFQTPEYAREITIDFMNEFLKKSKPDYTVSSYLSIIKLFKNTDYENKLQLGGTVHHIRHATTQGLDFNYVLHMFFLHMFEGYEEDEYDVELTYHDLIMYAARSIDIYGVCLTEKYRYIKILIDICIHVYPKGTKLPSSLYEMIAHVERQKPEGAFDTRQPTLDYFQQVKTNGNYTGDVSPKYKEYYIDN